jgi:hypothetical protein
MARRIGNGVRLAIAGLAAVGLLALAVLSTGAWGATQPATPPGGPAPKSLVGRYHAKFSLDDFRKAPLPRPLPNKAWVEELVILNSLPGSPQGIGLHDLDGGSPTIPFGVKGNVLYLSCISENEKPLRLTASYRWKLQRNVLTLVKIKDPCGVSRYGKNQAYILTKHVWQKVATR